MKKTKMWSELIFFVIIIIEAEAILPDNDPIQITFKIKIKQSNTLICDHSDYKKEQNIYTVLEGEQFTIVTKNEDNNIINHFICKAYTDEKIVFNYKKTYMKNITTFMGEKRMGTLWICKIMTHRDNPLMKPVVRYKDSNYAAAYCFMKIHVRQKEPPQTILVNNMIVPAVREYQVEKDVDFTAEYQYADEDIVNVTCFNSLNETPLTMEYEMAGTKSNESTMKDISSSKMIGFVTKLHSGHNNSYMICTNTERYDYTKVMIRFVMRTEFNIISIAINGMVLRPILKVTQSHYYVSECKFLINQPITVTCEVVRTDVKLLVLGDFKKSGIQKTELIKDKKTEMKFYLKPGDNKSLPCSADYDSGAMAESVYIQFTTANFLVDPYPSMHMELPSSGTVMELHSYGDYKLTVILYEFKHDDTLQLTCGPLIVGRPPAPVTYLQLNNNGKCRSDGCTISQTLHVTREHPPIACYIKEENAPDSDPDTTRSHINKEIRVILRESVPTSTEPSTTNLSTAFTDEIFTNKTAADPPSKTSKGGGNTSTLVYSLSAFGIATMVMILVVLSYICIKKQCCVRQSAPIPSPIIDPSSVFYENLLSVFTPINEREAMDLQNHYEEILVH